MTEPIITEQAQADLDAMWDQIAERDPRAADRLLDRFHSLRCIRSDPMSFELFQDVILNTDLPELGLCAGDVGTVVERHVVAGLEDGYSVEFFDMTGRTVAVVTVPASQLRAPTSADRPSARTLTPTSR
jgi:hypothetical protein